MNDSSPEVILASSSPRRQELLAQIGVRFRVVVPDADETPLPDEQPLAFVERIAKAKVDAVVIPPDQGDVLIIGSDTSVISDSRILGKPRDFLDFEGMMQSLSGSTHEVLTAVAVSDKRHCRVRTSVSEVRFKTLTESEIRAYWRTGEPCDKAGGYAIQGAGAMLIEELRGSFSAVMGLPLFETAELMRKFGVDLMREQQ